MNATKGKSFWDTNLWVYLNTQSPAPDDIAKKVKLQSLLLQTEEIVVSAQVLNEIANVLMKKYKQPESEVASRLNALITQVEVHPLTESTTFQALELKAKYGFSWYDGLIAAVALQTGCEVLYSEDLQNGLFIDGRLTVVNPFTV